ncbi:putative clathrin assembly protein At5g35200 [Macadamia integrifolia]|uniref:putative clathrin assembly protein At5g35200 n=1 Tax=Macadamia integrifolia TaxID=60698 RepID=UPI001C501D6C|nr:putative clathrin assembly protein At5g35200 [Macadamia integrifolia]XP_042494750.1 putative clathrin assembly protein At5g35200 [Macadamia integrifolia]XP_042494751.1 putative clathrin assembly protein At5g35200 [Macadamia integrifolia]
MIGGVGTQQSLRKALGVLKDSTKVGLAKVNSEYKELDVAIVKATNHVEHTAKEKHIRTIFDAVSASRPRADVAYCIHGLARRLAKTHNWAVALKTLIVIHRALREVDTTFREEIINYSRGRGHMLNLSHFKDDSSPNAWDYSAWVRTYALFLEERLECFRILKYDVEIDRWRTRELDTPDMLEQLPALQQLLYRLLACQPEGAAVYNTMIQYALSIVVSESTRIYAAIDDGTLNLVDKFFEMQRHDAIRALEIYRKARNQAEKLSEFSEICRGLDVGWGKKLPKVEKPSESFITAMEDYLKESPQPLMLQRTAANDERGATPRAETTPKVALAIDYKEEEDVEEKEKPESPVLPPEPSQADQSAPVTAPIIDLLGLDEISHEVSQLEEKNALALAIASSENSVSTAMDLTSHATGWELALVSAPSSNEAVVATSKLAGGFDKLTLDSLYDDAMARRTNQNGTYHMGQVAPNPFEAAQYSQDPFYASNSIAPPTNVQMASMAQQQQSLMIEQQQQQQQQQLMIGPDSSNPFGNPYMGQGGPPNPPQNPYTGLI